MNVESVTRLATLHSGDALICIRTGVETAEVLLRALDADMSLSSSSRSAFGSQADVLRAWTERARRLIGATQEQESEHREAFAALPDVRDRLELGICNGEDGAEGHAKETC